MQNAGVMCLVVFATTLFVVRAEEDKRATWLETRDMQENFKDLVHLSLQELVREGYVNPQTITGAAGESAAEKRGKQQGFCFRKTRTGRFLPYICWKDGKDAESS